MWVLMHHHGIKDIVGQRDQTSVWDQGDGCGMEMAAVGQREKAQDGGSCHGIEKTGMGWRVLSYARQDGHRTGYSLWDRWDFLRME